jgi:MFS family permease
MIPLYLVIGRGWDHSWANTVVSASRMAAMVTAVLGGWSVDRLGKKVAMSWFLVATGLSTMWMGLAPDRWMVTAACLQPMLAVCFFPAGFAVLSQIVPAQLRSVSISLVIPVGILMGAGLIPSALGLLAEHQVFSLGFVALGFLLLTSVVLLNWLRLPPR